MNRTPTAFKVVDVVRALKAARKVGMTVEIRRDGTLIVIPIPTQPSPDLESEIFQNAMAPRRWVL